MGRAKKVKYSYYGGYIPSEYIYLAVNGTLYKLDDSGNEIWSITASLPSYFNPICETVSYDNNTILLGFANNNPSSPGANGDMALFDTDGNDLGRAYTKRSPALPESYGHVLQVFNNSSGDGLWGMYQARWIVNTDINFNLIQQYDNINRNSGLYGNGIDKIASNIEVFASVTQRLLNTNPLSSYWTNFFFTGANRVQIWSDRGLNNRFYFPVNNDIKVYTNTGTTLYTKTHGAYVNSTYSDSDGNFYLAGASSSGVTVRKYNSAGTELLTISTPGTAFRVRTGASGNIYINWRDGDGKANLAKYDTSGNLLWNNQYEITLVDTWHTGGSGLDIQVI